MRYALNGKYPIETKDQLIKTAAYLDRYITKFHPKERVSVSLTIEKRAAELGVHLDNNWMHDYTRPYKSCAVSPDFSRNIDMRKQACYSKSISMKNGSVDACKILDKCRDGIEKNGAMATANFLFEFDKMANLEYQWDRYIPDPFKTVFGSSSNPKFDAVKVAGAVTDYELKKIACDSSCIEKISSALGNVTARKFVDNPVDTVSRMSSIDKEAFLNAIGK